VHCVVCVMRCVLCVVYGVVCICMGALVLSTDPNRRLFKSKGGDAVLPYPSASDTRRHVHEMSTGRPRHVWQAPRPDVH